MTPSPDSEARTLIGLLWQHIRTEVEAWVFPHHVRHEPGGDDAIELDLDELHNVYTTGKQNGNTIVWNATTEHWEDGAGGSGGGKHGIYFEMTGTLAEDTYGGPANVFGGTLSITRAITNSDVAATIVICGVTLTLTGAGLADAVVSGTLADGAEATAVVSGLGAGGTYIRVTLLAAE